MTLLTELRKRWPAIVGILRGKTVVYAAEIDAGTLLLRNPHGAVVMDTHVSNSPGAGISVGCVG